VPGQRHRRPPPPCLGSAPPEAAALEAGSHARGAASMGRQAGRHLGVLLRGGWRTTGRTIEEGGSLEGERLAPADLVEDDRWRLQLMCGSVAMAGAGRQRARKEGGRWARNRQPRWLNGFGFLEMKMKHPEEAASRRRRGNGGRGGEMTTGSRLREEVAASGRPGVEERQSAVKWIGGRGADCGRRRRTGERGGDGGGAGGRLGINYCS
jgi:hypothetical protein